LRLHKSSLLLPTAGWQKNPYCDAIFFRKIYLAVLLFHKKLGFALHQLLLSVLISYRIYGNLCYLQIRTIIFTWMQDDVFSLHWTLKYKGCRKFAYEALNQISLKWTTQRQTKACFAKSSCEIRTLWDIMQSKVVTPYHNFRTTFWPHLQGWRNQKDRTWLKLTESVFCFGTLSL
jgi:hypothetical protein